MLKCTRTYSAQTHCVCVCGREVGETNIHHTFHAVYIGYRNTRLLHSTIRHNVGIKFSTLHWIWMYYHTPAPSQRRRHRARRRRRRSSTFAHCLLVCFRLTSVWHIHLPRCDSVDARVSLFAYEFFNVLPDFFSLLLSLGRVSRIAMLILINWFDGI